MATEDTLDFLFRPRNPGEERGHEQREAAFAKARAQYAAERKKNREEIGHWNRLPNRHRAGGQPGARNRRLARNCRNLRRKAGYKTAVAATALGIVVDRLWRMESGEVAFPAMTIWALHKLYGVPLEAFFEGVDDDDEPGGS